MLFVVHKQKKIQIKIIIYINNNMTVNNKNIFKIFKCF